MKTIKVKIDCEGQYCGECEQKRANECSVFQELIPFMNNNGYVRCQECLDAEEKVMDTYVIIKQSNSPARGHKSIPVCVCFSMNAADKEIKRLNDAAISCVYGWNKIKNIEEKPNA